MTSKIPWHQLLRPEVIQRRDELIHLRREFHRFPELSWEERETSQRIVEWLAEHEIAKVETMASTGVVALIEGSQPGPTILYRADTDGLPIAEETGLEFASSNPRVMHACGHDGHIAVGLTLADLLNQGRQSLKGNVKVVFQPAEEKGEGAAAMIQAGVMENPRVDAVLGLHVAAEMPLGVLGITSGPVCAADDVFKVTILGKGGHAALPHRAIDPIVAGAQFVTALQTIVSRNVEPWQTAVVTVGTFHGGTKDNIIPDTVEIEGTIRAFDMELMERIPQRIESLLKGITQGMGAEYRFQHRLNCPPLVNDPGFTQRVRRHAAALVGEAAIISPTIPASDDVAFFLQKVPGSYLFLGAADASLGSQSHHQPRFNFDDRSLALGLELALRVIEDYLG